MLDQIVKTLSLAEWLSVGLVLLSFIFSAIALRVALKARYESIDAVSFSERAVEDAKSSANSADRSANAAAMSTSAAGNAASAAKGSADAARRLSEISQAALSRVLQASKTEDKKD